VRNVNYDAIVIGVGGVGSATLYQLARRGLRVLGIDRFAPGHARGSSHGETRAIRKAYFEHPDYVPLLTRAYELWRELNAEAGQTLFHQTGILEVGPAHGILLAGVRAAAKEHQLAIEEVSVDEVMQRFPGFRVPTGSEAVYEPEGGYLLVEECVKQHAELAKRLGAELAIGSSVTSWEGFNGDIHVRTDTENFVTRNLIITAGAWANDLLGQLGIQLRVLRKHLHWYAAKPEAYRQDRNSPVFFYETPGGCFYGFPSLVSQVQPLVKIAEHTGGELETDPLNCNRSVDEDEQLRVEKFMSECMPQMTCQLARHEVCMYTMTEDEHFVVDRHPEFSNVAFAAGLSGHGFKFATVLGECLADWVEGKQTHPSIRFLSADRF
jgi:sarcosine oxidase